MTTLSYTAVPHYLHRSAFYCSLSGDDENGTIQVPVNCFKQDDGVSNLKELAQMLRVIQFWGLDRLRSPVVSYFINHPWSEWTAVARDVLGENSTLLADLEHIFYQNLSTSVGMVRSVEVNRDDIIDGFIASSSVRSASVADAAARHGNLPLLQKLHNAGFNWGGSTCHAAARKGHFECLKYAHTNGCPVTVNMGLVAAISGHADCFRYIAQFAGIGTKSNYKPVVKNGHLECLKVLHEHSYSFSFFDVMEAGEGGHLECVKYLIEVCGCEWDECVTRSAAQHNQVHVLQYALESGCPHKYDLLFTAGRYGSLACIQYLVDVQHMPNDADLFGVCFDHAQIDCLKYLVCKDCPFLTYRFGYENNIYYDYGVRRERANFDADFLQCIELAVEHGWVLTDKLRGYVCKYARHELPLCVVYIESSS